MPIIKISVPNGTNTKLKSYLPSKVRASFIDEFIINQYSELSQSRDILKKRGDFERINVNLSDEAHEKLQALATIHDLKLSEVFRDALVPLLVAAEMYYVSSKNKEVDRISVLKQQLNDVVVELKTLLPTENVNELLDSHKERRVLRYNQDEGGLVLVEHERETNYTVHTNK